MFDAATLITRITTLRGGKQNCVIDRAFDISIPTRVVILTGEKTENVGKNWCENGREDGGCFRRLSEAIHVAI